MKQCPTCGHRTNDDVCPVCGAATVVLQSDPQEKAQRTIQYQRFDPSKVPGATAGGHAVPAGSGYTQKDPGAIHHMQPGAGAVSPSHPAKAAPQPIPQGQPAAPAQPAQRPAAPETQPGQNQTPAQQRPATPQTGQPASMPQTAQQAQTPAAQQPAAPTMQNMGGNQHTPAPEAQLHPAGATQHPAGAGQQPAAQSQRQSAQAAQGISSQHMNEFRPSTLPRRSQKYRQKYASYVPGEPAPAASHQSEAAPAVPHQTAGAQEASVDQTAQPVSGAPAASSAQNTQNAQNAPVDQAPKPQGSQAAPHTVNAQPIPEARTAQAAQDAPAVPEPQHLPTGQEGSQTETIAEAPAPEEKPAAHHVLLSPEELEEFLDNQPDDGEEDGLPEIQEEPKAPQAFTDQAASEKPAEAKIPDQANQKDQADQANFTAASSDPAEPDSAGADQETGAAEQADPTEMPAASEFPDNTDIAEDSGDPDAAETIADPDNIDSAHNAVDADSADSPDSFNNAEPADFASSTDQTGNTDDSSQQAENTDDTSQSGENSETENEPEEEHLPTRQELIQKHNAQIRRENNRRYAEEHASRATRRWQEESEEEPFAIVRGTCYYSALESETTVRGNFSKKRYKDDALPQNEPVSYEDSEWYQGFENAYDPWGDYVEPDENEKKKGVSYKAWFIILLLIIFWPAGLILMWVRKKFPLAVRIIITLIIAAGLAFEGYFLYNYGPAMYEEYMYGDSSTTTYQTPGSDSDSSDTANSAAATENQQKALDKANEYIDTLALSRDGLVKQLEYDGYSADVATYAADNCSANWNKEAKEMAEEYMDSTTYTYKAMVQQLEDEGFTRDQAKFGAKAVGLE